MAEASASATTTFTVVVAERVTKQAQPVRSEPVRSQSDEKSSCWSCFKLVMMPLFIVAIVAFVGTILGVYAVYLLTVLPIVYAGHSCYKAKKRGRFIKGFQLRDWVIYFTF